MGSIHVWWPRVLIFTLSREHVGQLCVGQVVVGGWAEPPTDDTLFSDVVAVVDYGDSAALVTQVAHLSPEEDHLRDVILLGLQQCLDEQRGTYREGQVEQGGSFVGCPSYLGRTCDICPCGWVWGEGGGSDNIGSTLYYYYYERQETVWLELDCSTPFLGHDIGFLTLDPKLDPLLDPLFCL